MIKTATLYDIETAKLITNEEYLELIDPIFVSQTPVSMRGSYFMFWECDGVLYKTKNWIG